VHLIHRRAGIREPRVADASHLCTSKRYDPKADEPLLGTDAVDVVVKASNLSVNPMWSPAVDHRLGLGAVVPTRSRRILKSQISNPT
jgi:hypothetical protein